ncbi:MAG: 3-dehydroquinate synthase [Sphingobacteriales bacterium]|nr:MAG: 3-dehydroquinate synthase [Sphingobacteriales bacterium]
MELKVFRIAQQQVVYYFDAVFAELDQLADKSTAIIITDKNVLHAHKSKFEDWRTIVIEPGEQQKNFDTIKYIIDMLAGYEADRNCLLIGVGGGVVTDITGFVASIYMRGIRFGFVPTSLLNMVDASLGGKNGIDFGLYKNLVGSITQPEFILQDVSLLTTLPETEWENGFAEIIKHACIKDKAMLEDLSRRKIKDFQANKALLGELIRRNVFLKLKVVQKDPFEARDRKLLNFGHTIGHAIENSCAIPHGKAVAIGMVLAAKISVRETGFDELEKLKTVLSNYNLPVSIKFQASAVFELLKLDKKRAGEQINFILLQKMGKALIKPIDLTELQQYLHSFEKEL